MGVSPAESKRKQKLSLLMPVERELIAVLALFIRESPELPEMVSISDSCARRGAQPTTRSCPNTPDLLRQSLELPLGLPILGTGIRRVHPLGG